ncbi:putative major sperm protein (MSP) [Medicago truncatula]|uniref:Putative major sperm protein (MSP) n=1 Tax=Medicago truncatula TaxID=3880 RepID=A0A396I139_MEDTR|nr:vesicle-associated protein 3-1 isoform X2 [Medicago truncatula]RHN59336.1 putative major sperm protein (MSP) [Medicago truncatula]
MGETISAAASSSASKLKNQEDSFYLHMHPHELHFPLELKKNISCCLQLSNKSDNYLAFKVKTTIPEKYCVRPNIGVMLPMSTCDIIVTMQALEEAPPDMQCKDKFLLQSIVARPGATTKDITSDMFYKDSGYEVKESKFRAVCVAPPPSPNPPLSVHASESLDQEKKQISELTEERDYLKKGNKRLQQALAELQISKLTKERNDVNEKNKKLEQEVNTLIVKSQARQAKNDCCCCIL